MVLKITYYFQDKKNVKYQKYAGREGENSILPTKQLAGGEREGEGEFLAFNIGL